MTAVGIDTGQQAGKLRSAALHDTVAVSGVGCAQNGKGHSGMPKYRAGNLPAVHNVGERGVLRLEGQDVGVLRGEVLASVVVAIAIIARQVSRQRRQNSSGRKLQKPA